MKNSIQKILILGGYGNFGKRIAESLAAYTNASLIIAGRNLAKAESLCTDLLKQYPNAQLMPVVLDIFSDDFSTQLKNLKPFIVIHTGGPFQGQDYRVPEAAIDAGAHYIDLADDRRFVCDISKLNQRAQERNLIIVSGASSVPGLSSVIIDYHLSRFEKLNSIDIAIAPGNRAERGEATVRAILSYTGHPISVFENNSWQKKYGWMSPRKINFGSAVGNRWLANVDVPDLELFPARYAGVESVKFQAGLELGILHWTMVLMAWWAKYKLIKNWAPWVKPIIKTSNWFLNVGTDIGGMRIELRGLDRSRNDICLEWQLTAEKGVGPYIPTLSTIILAQKLLNDEIKARGALACLGLYTLNDVDVWFKRWGIYHQTFQNGNELV